MTGTVVFLGPSLARREAERLLPPGQCVVYLPPARQGDLVRAVREHRASTILLIDGLFHGAQSVWHREILWALDQGVRVLGAASMGALRAAECCRFGMEPLGVIAEAYRSGCFPGCGSEAFEDDDEVAMIHAPEQAGFVSLSDAMVDLRASLVNARDQGVIDESMRLGLTAWLKALPFAERSEARLLDRASFLGCTGLASFLPSGRVRLKAGDAALALRHLASGAPAPERSPFRFERALVWRDAGFEDGASVELSAVERIRLVRIALEPERLLRLSLAALALLGVGTAPPDATTDRAGVDALRHRFGLWRRQDLESWAGSRGLDGTAVMALARRLAALEGELADPPSGFGRALLDAAILTEPAPPELEARSGPRANGAESLAALVWFFELRLGTGLPRDLDAWARRLGLADEQELTDAVVALWHHAPRHPPDVA